MTCIALGIIIGVTKKKKSRKQKDATKKEALQN
jgi:hypothetical protein